MKHRLVLLAALGLALAGCSSDPAPAAAPVPSVVTTTTAAPTTTTTITPPPVTTTTVAPVVETVTETEVVATAMTDAECDAFAASSSLPNAELFPLMRELGCGPRLDELEAAAEASIAAEAAAVPTTDYSDLTDCPAGQVFSGLGGGCMSPEDAAEISYTEGLCGGGYGPVEICGPGRSDSGG